MRGTIPRIAQLSYDLLVKTTVYALCVALVFVLLVGVGSADANNTAPVLDPISTVQINESETATIVLVASDPDNNTITYSKNVTFGNLSWNIFTWATSYEDSGTYNIQFTVSDGNLTDTKIGIIEVGNTNRAPVLAIIGSKSVDEDTELSFTVSATDEDLGDTLTYSAVGLPTGATLDHSSGVFTWTPTFDQAGIYPVQFNVTDGNDIDFEIVTITVGGVNRAPVLDIIGSKSVDEDTELSFTVSATDEDLGDTLTHSVVGLPSGATFDSSSKVFTWTPTFDQAGIYPVQFNVTDGNDIDFEIVTITVGGVNRAPVLAIIGSKSVDEDTELSFTLSATDEDLGDTLTYSAVGLPTGATLDHSSGVFTWTPTFDQAGIYPVQFNVTDGTDIDFEIVTITVGGVNRAPVLAIIGSKSVDEDTELSFTLSATDEDLGDTLTYSVVGLPTGANLDSSSGLFAWTPTFDQAGIYPVQFNVTDGTDIDFEIVTITVGGVNRAPVLAIIGSKSVDEDTELSFTVSATDEDLGDTLTYSVVSLPSGATFDSSSKVFTWTPTFDQAGIYSVQFNVTDGTDIDFEIVTIIVGGVNRAPVLAIIGSKSIDEDTELSFTVSATDEDLGDTLTYSVVGPPSGATFDSSSKVFTWTPTFDQAGIYSVQFNVTDGTDIDFEIVTITVGGVNRAPVLDIIGSKSVDEDTELSFTVSATDEDLGDTLTYSVVGLPSGATFDSSSKVFTWTPTFDQAGIYSVQFNVTDGTDIDFEIVTITVGGVNRAPVLDIIGSKSVDEDTELSFTVSASDEDLGDTLTYSAVGLPTGATLDHSSGVFTWTPSYKQAGTHSIQFKVTDETYIDFETIDITVNDVNRPPILDPIGDRSVDENTELSFTVNASDDDGDALTYSADGLPTGAILDHSSGVFTWTPTYEQAGTHSVQFKVTDNTEIDLEIMTITVGNVNRAPTLDLIGSKSVNENNTLSFTVSASDDDGDTLTYSAVGLPTGANLNSSSRVFTWDPTFDQAGTYSIQFNVTDGMEIDSEIVTITVHNVNIAPILDPIPGTKINETETATIVLGASDPDNDIITYSTNATFGSLTNNTFTWTSEYDDDGIYYLEFTVSDGDLTDTEIGVIVVGDADRAPILDHIGSKSVNENTELSFTLNAIDPDGDTLIYSAIALPTGATLNSSNGLFKWIPSDTQAGTYHVIFQVTDKLLQDFETVKITVDGVNTPITPTGFGGSSGRSVFSTGEEYENIEVRDVIRVYVHKDSTITYEFKEEINAIDFIKFDAKISAGYIAATIEVLKDTSALVSTAPSGEVYQNINIWIGNAIYATGARIANPIIEFKVARSWITENNIDISKIQLCRYSSGVWNPLPTTKINEDEKYIYFTSKTPGFSPFAITGTQISNTSIANTLTENISPAYFSTPSTLTDDVNAPVSENTDVPDQEEEEKTSGVFALAIGLIGISVLVVGIIIKKEEIKDWIYQRKDSDWNDWYIP